MDQKGAQGHPLSKRATQFIALLVIVGLALVASAVVVWLASATGLGLWAFIVVAVIAMFIVLALAD